MFLIREWDPTLRAWVLFDSADEEESAKEKGRGMWRRGALGIKIDHYPGPGVSGKRTIVEEKRSIY